MKRAFWMVLLIALVAAVFSASAYAEPKSGYCGGEGDGTNLTWTLDDDGVLVIEGTGRMEGYGRTYSADGYKTAAPWGIDIKQVFLKEGVTSISNYAFCGCTSLTNISIPDGMISIGNSAFFECFALSNVVIPNTITYIGESSFFGCINIDYIGIPNGVSCICDHSFESCSSLVNVSIPDSVTAIGSYAFAECCNLHNVIIPDSIEYINECTFAGCSSFTQLTIPKNVKRIERWAFARCKLIESVIIPDNVIFLGDGVFAGCTNLKTVSLPNSIDSIGVGTFYECASLTNVTIPDTVFSIGDQAFSDCYSLVGIAIPANVESIGDYAFQECIHLSVVIIYGKDTTIGTYAFCSNPTICCYEESEADYWAANDGSPVIYLEELESIESLRCIALPTDFKLLCGESCSITISVFPIHDNPTITWTSSNPTSVSVDENGMVMALTPGQAIITAQVGCVSDSMEITAYRGLENFQLSDEDIWVLAKNDIQISVSSVTPVDADMGLAWTSSDETIATVNATGLVHAIKPGDVTITATSANGIARKCLVHSCYSVSAVAFAEDDVRLNVGAMYQLIANVTMRTQSCVNHLVTFTSSDEDVAMVDEHGLVTTLSAGTATITATSENGYTDECVVVVLGGSAAFTLPASTTIIEEEAFASTSADIYVLPSTIATISSRAFADLQHHALIVIPTAAPITIAPDAFAGSSVTIECPVGSPTEAWAASHGIPTVNP